MVQKKKVLFLCTGNSCRSQMAEGFLEKLAGDFFKVVSAGTHPSQVHPLAIKVMQEQGIDISQQSSKSMILFMHQHFDDVITLCESAKQAYLLFPGKYRHIHWDIEDPVVFNEDELLKLKKFREVRDQIDKKIKEYINQKKEME